MEDASGLSPLRTLAAEIDCGRAGRFRSEVYELDVARTGVKRYWHLRWLVEFLGGTDVPNFVGNLVPVLRNKVVERMDDLWSGEPEALVEKAKGHVLDSSWSAVQEKAQQHRKGAKRKDAGHALEADTADDTAVPDRASSKAAATACRETCCSTLGLAVLLLHWACNMRSNMKWKLEADDVKSRCRDVLRGLTRTFFVQGLNAVTDDSPPFYLNLADGRLDKDALVQQGGGRVFQSLQAQDGRWMEVADVLTILVGEDKNRAFSQTRRKRARVCIARVLEILVERVDSSSSTEHMVWNKVQVKQLGQMRWVQVQLHFVHSSRSHSS